LSEDQNSLNFEFALAGYEEKEIKVIGGKNSFTVRASKESTENTYVLHKGISDKAVDFSINVDEQYDTKKAKVSYLNGLLSVSIPKAKEAESIMLFG
jgi:HSP20 family molecular chaperone IbpA